MKKLTLLFALLLFCSIDIVFCQKTNVKNKTQRSIPKKIIGEYIYPKGSFFENEKYYGELKNGLPNGKGKLLVLNKKNYWEGVYEGDFVDGRLEGYGTYCYTTGLTHTGSYLNNYQEGYGIMTDKFGSFSGYFHAGKRYGRCKALYPDGRVSFDGYIRDEKFLGDLPFRGVEDQKLPDDPETPKYACGLELPINSIVYREDIFQKFNKEWNITVFEAIILNKTESGFLLRITKVRDYKVNSFKVGNDWIVTESNGGVLSGHYCFSMKYIPTSEAYSYYKDQYLTLSGRFWTSDTNTWCNRKPYLKSINELNQFSN